ncbi:MAG: hypothetical protein WCD89_27480 [Anaerocolumna sp.]
MSGIFYLFITRILLPCFFLLIIRKFMYAFFPSPRKNVLRYFVWFSYYLFQVLTNIEINISPLLILVLNIFFVFLISSIAFYVSLRRRLVFSMLICAVWMLVEVIIGIILGTLGIRGSQLMISGSVISKLYMLIFASLIYHYLQQKNWHDISIRYILSVLLFPVGSIYLMHNILKITVEYNEYSFFAISSSVLLLSANYVIFEFYDWMTQDADIKEKNSLYEQQLELCGRQAELEIY